MEEWIDCELSAEDEPTMISATNYDEVHVCVVEQYSYTDRDKAQQRFIKAICELCSRKYSCMTDTYKMKIRDKDKFVLIPKKEKKLEVSCKFFDKIN